MAKKDKNPIEPSQVKDIPGRETAKSPQDIDGSGSDNDVSPDERRALASAGGREIDTEDDVLDEAALDSTDEDGDPLNEGSFGRDVSGDDLDIPGDEDEEDEENSDYSTDKNEDDSDINYDA